MRRAIILHGTDGMPEESWRPWLRRKFEAEGYEVWIPALPENHTPNRELYGDFLFGQGWDFTDNIVIGHSSGAVEVLNLLMDERCPKIHMGIMVGAWAGGVPNGYDKDNTDFENLFPPEGFDFERIKSKAEKLAFFHGDNDPYCPLEQAQYLAKSLDAQLSLIPGGQHLGMNLTEFPQLWNILKDQLVIGKLTDEMYMQKAIDIAQASAHEGGAKIGAIIVDNSTGEIVAKGESLVGPTHDPTSHAEVNAIREASRLRQTDKLKDATLYSTLEPCHMCLSAAAWARIPVVMFGAYKEDVHHDSYFDIKGSFSDEEEAERMNIHSHEQMLVRGGICRDECVRLLYNVDNKTIDSGIMEV